MARYRVKIAVTATYELDVEGKSAAEIRKRLTDYGIDLVPQDFPCPELPSIGARIVSIKPDAQ